MFRSRLLSRWESSSKQQSLDNSGKCFTDLTERHRSVETLSPSPSALNTKPYSKFNLLDPEPYILNLKSSTLHPTLETLNSEPSNYFILQDSGHMVDDGKIMHNELFWLSLHDPTPDGVPLSLSRTHTSTRSLSLSFSLALSLSLSLSLIHTHKHKHTHTQTLPHAQ